MNMKKVAQAFRLLADAMEETAARFEDVPTTDDPVGVAGMAEKKPKPEPKPTPTSGMLVEDFTTSMQAIGREFGTAKLHAVLPAVWGKYTDGVARMSAIPADRYAEIVEFAREEVEKQA